MDARRDLSRILGLVEGEVDVIGNAGAIITEDVIVALAGSQRLLTTREILVMPGGDPAVVPDQQTVRTAPAPVLATSPMSPPTTRPTSATSTATGDRRLTTGLAAMLAHEAAHEGHVTAEAAAGAGDLISEIALAIEMGADAADIALTIAPHPTLAETVGMAAEASKEPSPTCTFSSPK